MCVTDVVRVDETLREGAGGVTLRSPFVLEQVVEEITSYSRNMSWHVI